MSQYRSGDVGEEKDEVPAAVWALVTMLVLLAFAWVFR